MNREDIIRMARDAGASFFKDPANPDDESVLFFVLDLEEADRFAALVAAHVRETEFKPDWNTYRNGVKDGAAEEREQCAKLCETIVTPAISWVTPHDFHWAAHCCASEIRARGKQ